MRRIYESSALDRDDDVPFKPTERSTSAEPQAARTVPARWLSRTLLPEWLCRRAISVRVSSPATTYERSEPIPFTVELTNALPLPVVVSTRSPRPWYWHVDGARDASHVAETLPDDPGELAFDRGERKTFRRHWRQSFRISETEWEPASPGEYTIGASLDVEDPTGIGLSGKTTVKIE